MPRFWPIVAAALSVFAPAAHAGTEGQSALDFEFQSIDGKPLPLSAFKGHVLLVVNTASFCGFTPQYTGLQKLYDTYEKAGLVIVGVPSNDFGGQEPKSEKEVKEFCQGAFGITFPLTQKYHVRGREAHPFYTYAYNQLGLMNVPAWNFHKYLIGRDGHLVAAYGSITTPDSPRLIDAIKTELAKSAPN